MIFKFDIKLNFLCNREIIKLSVKFDFSELSLIFRLKFDFKFDFEFYATGPCSPNTEKLATLISPVILAFHFFC